tara:strand:+ start:38613 stop:40367 length:1755 start_codon:yes stop_codon:yes gene_type:complete
MNANLETDMHKSSQDSSMDDEINFQEIFYSIVRRWKWLSGGIFIGLGVGAFQLLTTKPLYQGEFQIVIGETAGQGAKAALLAQNPGLASVVNMGGGGMKDSLETEVEILYSPSVLLPIFEAVKEKKPQSAGMIFKHWVRKSISVSPKRNTTVLTVKFKDEDKTLIKPITQLISKKYQSYSNQGRDREINSVIEYLEKQIKIIKPIAKESAKKALDYGLKNNLSAMDGLPIAGIVTGAESNTNFGGKSFIGASSGALSEIGGSRETAKSMAKAKVIALELLLKEAENEENANLFINPISEFLQEEGTPDITDQIIRIETEIAEKKSRFHPGDPILAKLIRQRKELIDVGNKQIQARILGQLNVAKSTLASLDISTDLLSKHRELTQKSLRDSSTLVNLQNQLASYQMEKARAADPWKLISSPTVQDQPISPRKLRILALSLISGFILGSTSALIADYRSNIIFSEKELKKKMPIRFLNKIRINKREEWEDTLTLIRDNILTNSSNIGLISVGDIDEKSINMITEEFKRIIAPKSLIVSQSLIEIKNCDAQIALASTGSIKRSDLDSFQSQINIQNQNISGWLLIS